MYDCVAWWRKELKTCEGIVDMAVHRRMWCSASSHWTQTPTLLLREAFVFSYSTEAGDSAVIRAGQYSEIFSEAKDVASIRLSRSSVIINL
jgi:hypothetical protein